MALPKPSCPGATHYNDVVVGTGVWADDRATAIQRAELQAHMDADRGAAEFLAQDCPGNCTKSEFFEDSSPGKLFGQPYYDKTRKQWHAIGSSQPDAMIICNLPRRRDMAVALLAYVPRALRRGRPRLHLGGARQKKRGSSRGKPA